MKYYVNEDCIGCGLCAAVCPEVFSMTEEGVAKACEQTPAAFEDAAEKALEKCPVAAIEAAEG